MDNGCGFDSRIWFAFALGTMGGLAFSLIALVFFMPAWVPMKRKNVKQVLELTETNSWLNTIVYEGINWVNGRICFTGYELHWG